MNLIASRTFECSDIKAGRAGSDQRQHGSCLACGARWSQDNHDARLGSGGSVTELSVTGSCQKRGGDATTIEPSRPRRWSILLIFRNVNRVKFCSHRLASNVTAVPRQSRQLRRPERSTMTPKIKEHNCAACNGTGFPTVKQPVLATHKIYQVKCETCAGKGRIADTTN